MTTTSGATHRQPAETDAPADPRLVADQLTEALKEAAEHATRKADQAPELARRAARETTRRWVVWVIVAAVLVSTVMSWASLVIARSTAASQEVAAAATRAIDAEQQRQIDALNGALREANDALLAQGKPVVPPPAEKDATEALAALVTARVLAALPANAAKPGPQGVGISSIRPARRGAQCVLVVRLTDPATGGITEQNTGPVADSVCGGDAPPRTTTVTATPQPAPTSGDRRPVPSPASTGPGRPSATPTSAAPASSRAETSEPSLPALPTR